MQNNFVRAKGFLFSDSKMVNPSLEDDSIPGNNDSIFGNCISVSFSLEHGLTIKMFNITCHSLCWLTIPPYF